MNLSLLLIVLAAILFGTSGITAKYLINTYSLPPLTIAAARLLIAAPVLLALSKLRAKEKAPLCKKHVLWFVLCGITAAAYQLTFFMAVQHIMVSVATLIALCTTPIFVALISLLFFKEKLRLVTLAALSISIAGTFLIIGIGGSPAAGGAFNWGYALALGSGLAFAVYTLSSKSLLSSYPAVKVISLNFALGAICMLPFIRIPSHLPLPAWALLLYLGLVPTALAYLLFTTGLKKSSAANASIGTLFEPLTSTILSFLVMGEVFGISQIFGACLLCLALLLLVLNDVLRSVDKKSKRGDSHEEPCPLSADQL